MVGSGALAVRLDSSGQSCHLTSLTSCATELMREFLKICRRQIKKDCNDIALHGWRVNIENLCSLLAIQKSERIMKTIIIILMLGVGLCAIAAEQVPVEVQQVIDSAKIWKGKGMSGFYDNIRYIGFDSGTKISDIKYGEPFHFYLFTMYSYVNLDANAPISSKLKPRDEWALPLFQHSELKALIWIVRSPDRPNWQVGGYGFHGYGVVWEKACKAWPE